MKVDTNGIEMQDHVRDRVTGVEGIVTGIHQYVTGCARASVQPPFKDGKLPDAIGCDVLTLEVVSPGPRPERPVTAASVGGPQRDPHSRV